MDRQTSAALLIGCALLLGIIATGQEPKQEWRLKHSDNPGKVQFTVERRKAGSHWSTTNDVPFDNFHGLSRETIEHGGPAKFEYVQDAGRLICEGDFSWSRGSGTYRFEPNPQFSKALEAMGYSAPSEEQFFTMMLTDVSLAFARGVKDAGLGASTKQLIDLRIHGVSIDYIREAHDAGYQNFSAADYIDLAIHGVSTRFLRDLKGSGYNLYPREIVELAIHGVTSPFIADLKSAGYNLSSKEIVELAIHGVDSRYLRDLKDYGLQPPASDLVQLKIHGVSTGYLKGLKDAGYNGLFASEITDMTIHGVSLRLIQESKSLGYNFTPRQLVDLSVQGVDGSYLRRLQDSGMKNLTADQIVKLRIHGVD